jgi:hypothetical protein
MNWQIQVAEGIPRDPTFNTQAIYSTAADSYIGKDANVMVTYSISVRLFCDHWLSESALKATT